VVQILDAHEVEYAAYNVLEDAELREGVKKFRFAPPGFAPRTAAVFAMPLLFFAGSELLLF